MQMFKIKKLQLFKTYRIQHDWMGPVQAFQSTEKRQNELCSPLYLTLLTYITECTSYVISV